MKNISTIDKIIGYLSQCKIFNVVMITSSIVLFVAIPFVYIIASLFNERYTVFLFNISIFLAIIITPIALFMLATFSKHLQYYKKNLEEEIEKNHKKDLMLFEQARFVLMGEMMANISHQWKQPLNNMGLAIVSTRLSAHNPELLNKNFDIMEDNINFLSNTIDDFMSFFDKKTPKERKSIQSILDEIKSIIKAQLDSNGIKLTIEVDKRLKNVEITSVISQVLLNLINNAKDAMPSDSTNKEIILYFEIVNDELRISCYDNGSGINTAVAEKIFDPYFTTKEKKQGTGIGLYMSKQIIHKIFDGTIVLDTLVKNTCFRIKIPCSKNCSLKGVI